MERIYSATKPAVRSFARAAYYTGGGVTLAGFAPGRGQDEFGVALQFVMHPNTDPTIRNAVAFILQFELAL